MTTISRRNLIGAGTALGLSTLGSAAVSAAPVTKWDEETDVVVIGAGFAGLMAAYEVKKAGGDVVIIEKMPVPGGNSAINGGIMGVPGTEIQKAKGIEDSVDRMVEDTLKAGLHMNHPDKVRAMCEGAYDAYRVLVDEMGVKFSDTILKHEGGHSVPRSLFTATGSGSEIVNKQLAALEKLGVKPRTRTLFTTLHMGEDGAVLGITVKEGYRFPRADSGREKTIRARRAVVLAYGGFGADVAYRSIFDPKLGESFQTTNQPGATAEAWREAARIGAQMIQNDWIQCLPYTSPDEKGFGIGWAWAGHTQALGFWIDATTGERFVNELADRKIRCDAILAHNNLGHECLSIGDKKAAATFEVYRPGMLARQMKAGVVFEYKTLEDMAKAHKIPMEALKKTIAGVNEAIQTKKDPLGRPVNAELKPQTEGPWYVSRLSPKVHHCMGGILTTPKAEVISVTGKVIPGLYAAGEATGGVHGAVRLGSNATTDCIINGRIAGREAVARKPN